MIVFSIDNSHLNGLLEECYESVESKTRIFHRDLRSRQVNNVETSVSDDDRQR